MLGWPSTTHLQRLDCSLLSSALISCLVLFVALWASKSAAHEGEQAEIHTETNLAQLPEAQSLNITLVGSVQLEAPLDPTSRKFFTTTDLYIAGDYAYMGSENNRVHIVDISQPEAMQSVALVEMPGPALDIKVEGNLAVVAVQRAENTKMGVVVLDITDPSAPRILSEFFNQSWIGVHNLFLYQDRVYLAHSASRGISVLNLADPTQPFISGTWINDDIRFGSVIHDVFIRNDMAFLSDKMPNLGGLVVLDLADPDNPVKLSSLAIPEGLHNAWLEGDYVYCNQEFGGWEQPLHIVDVSDPRNPVESAVFKMVPPTGGEVLGAHNTWVEDGLLYWAFNGGGLRVLDVSDPVRPVEIGFHTTPSAWGAQPHSDGLIYLADSHLSTLMAFRFEQPAYAIAEVSLSTASVIAGRGEPIEVMAKLVARDATAKVRRVAARLLPDTSLLEWPLFASPTAAEGQFVGQVELPPDLPSGNYHLEVWVEDNRGRIYPYRDLPLAVFPGKDFSIIDESFVAGMSLEIERGPTAPQLSALGPVFRGSVAGAFAVETQSALGWDIQLQFARPLDLLGYEKLVMAFHPGDVKGRGLVMFLDEYRFDLSGRRSAPKWRINLNRKEWQVLELPLDILLVDRKIATLRFAGNLQGTFYIDALHLVAKNGAETAALVPGGVLPQSMSLAQNYPNPFNGETLIRFELAQTSQVDLTLFNLAGQQVANLSRGLYQAGSHRFSWDGRNAKGNAVASGVYIYRLQVGGQVESRKMVLMR